MVSDDGASDSNDLGAGVDEKDGGLARIIGDIFSADSAMVESSKNQNLTLSPKACFLAIDATISNRLTSRHRCLLDTQQCLVQLDLEKPLWQRL